MTEIQNGMKIKVLEGYNSSNGSFEVGDTLTISLVGAHTCAVGPTKDNRHVALMKTVVQGYLSAKVWKVLDHQDIQEAHQGQVYNPITNEWKWI